VVPSNGDADAAAARPDLEQLALLRALPHRGSWPILGAYLETQQPQFFGLTLDLLNCAGPTEETCYFLNRVPMNRPGDFEAVGSLGGLSLERKKATHASRQGIRSGTAPFCIAASKTGV
jgi:hypothetical protein